MSSQKKSDHYWCIWMLSREACCLGATNLPNQTGAGAGPGRARAGRHPLPSAECPGPHLPGTWGRSQLVPGEPRPGDRPRRSTGGRHRAKAAAPRASPPSPPSPPPGWHLVSLKREGACPPASPSWRTVAPGSGLALVSLPSRRLRRASENHAGPRASPT